MCLGSQHVSSHRKANNGSDIRNTRKGPDIGDWGSVGTVENQASAEFYQEATGYFEAQMMLKNKVALEPSEH